MEEESVLRWGNILKLAIEGSPEPPRRVEKTKKEWMEELDEETFRVTREHGTERPFSSEMCALFEPGIYSCACCDTPLFDAQSKFDSGSGWPSFTSPLQDNVVRYHSDTSYGMKRIEALCNICDAHLGHIFPDGPPPTRLRYCINAISLKKVSS